MGSPTIVLKTLVLDKAVEFGSIKDHFKSKTGRKHLQRLIYHLIGIGMISEVPGGTAERPSVIITTGNVANLMNGSEKVFFPN